jgi:hypothetical protein
MTTTYIQKDQKLNVKQAVATMLYKDRARFDEVLEGGRVSDYRMSRINEAYADGTEKELPPIQWEPQTGNLIDGRHRLIAAWIMGVEFIAADFHYELPDEAPEAAPAAEQAKINLINRYAYNPASNRFGIRLNSWNTDERYAEVQAYIAAKAIEDAADRAACIARNYA